MYDNNITDKATMVNCWFNFLIQEIVFLVTARYYFPTHTHTRHEWFFFCFCFKGD